MAERAARIDRIQLRDAGAPTVDGYLEVDAYLARDGILRYSDGIKSWDEYRPREELEAAAASWAHQPVTDDHPPAMLTPETVAQYMRGIVISTPTVVEADGVAYLAARLKVMDRALIDKITGGQRELSIGFVADVAPEVGETPTGQRYDAVQRSLVGNHVASVARGRAGPAVRVMLDSAQPEVPVCYSAGVPCADSRSTTDEAETMHSPTLEAARAPKIVKVPAGTKMDALKAWAAHIQTKIKGDEVGLPTTMAKLVGPDGTEIEVPTWVAALVAEALDAHKSAESAAEPAPDALAEAEGEPAPKPEDDPMAEPDKNKPKPPAPMTPDAVTALVRKRGRLERLAALAGVPSDKIDAADDLELARTYVGTVLPHVKARADKAEGAELDAFVEVAAVTPRETADENPFEVRRVIADSDSDDPIVMAYANAMARDAQLSS